MENRPSYVAHIPAHVRYDKEITASAKLLYGEIDCLAWSYDYCWASNRYFMEVFGVSDQSVTNWINQLKNKGYIHVEYERRKDNGRVTTLRKMWINKPLEAPQNYLEATQNILDEAPQNYLGFNTSSKVNTTREKKKINKKEKDEQCRKLIRDYTDNDDLFNAIIDWYEERLEKAKDGLSTRMVKRNLTDLTKASGGNNELAVQIVDKTIARGWAGFFPLSQSKNSGAQKKPYKANNDGWEQEFIKAGVDYE